MHLTKFAIEWWNTYLYNLGKRITDVSWEEFECFFKNRFLTNQFYVER